MSYRSRVYRQRNPRKEEGKKEPFFSHSDDNKAGKKNSFFQAKLAVNEPGDSYEKEADSVANSVVNKTGAKPAVQQKEISSIQRLSTTKEEEKVSSNDERMERDKEKPFQRKADEPEKKRDKVQRKEEPDKDKDKKVQMKEAPREKDEVQRKENAPLKEEDKDKSSAVQRKSEHTNTASPAIASKIEGSAGRGRQLPGKAMHEMSRAFGTDFSQVKVHDDNDAAEMNRELNAKAFTHGNDIYFNRGHFNPESAEGKFLLAHELTHVVQQNEHMIRRDTPAMPKFDFPVSLGFFPNFDVTYAPDIIKAGEGNVTYTHNIGLVFDSKIDAAKQEKFRKDFKTNVQSLWQDKFLFELNDPGFTHYIAHVKLDIEFVDDPKLAHTLMAVKHQPNDFRSNVEGRTSAGLPFLTHVAHLDERDASPEEIAKKNRGKGVVHPSLVQHVGNFDFDSAQINSDCETDIRKIESHIDKLPDDSASVDEPSFSAKIDYIGRASPEGNKFYNIELSKRRASAVKKRIETDKPKAKKIAANVTGEGADKTQNEAIKENYRRVNVLVYPFTPFSKLKDKDQNTAAHEFGHMIGFGDEYDERGDAKFEKKIAGDRPSHYEDVKSIMGQAAADELVMSQSSSMMSAGNEIKKGHYAFFLKALRDLTGKQGWTIK